jgi:hypothetical protein
MLGLVVNLMEFWHQSLFRGAGPLLVSKTELLLGGTLGPTNKDGEIMGVEWNGVDRWIMRKNPTSVTWKYRP